MFQFTAPAYSQRSPHIFSPYRQLNSVAGRTERIARKVRQPELRFRWNRGASFIEIPRALLQTGRVRYPIGVVSAALERTRLLLKANYKLHYITFRSTRLSSRDIQAKRGFS